MKDDCKAVGRDAPSIFSTPPEGGTIILILLAKKGESDRERERPREEKQRAQGIRRTGGTGAGTCPLFPPSPRLLVGPTRPRRRPELPLPDPGLPASPCPRVSPDPRPGLSHCGLHRALTRVEDGRRLDQGRGAALLAPPGRTGPATYGRQLFLSLSPGGSREATCPSLPRADTRKAAHRVLQNVPQTVAVGTAVGCSSGGLP